MAVTERVVVAPLIPAAAGRVLVSPVQFLVTGEDNLRIEGWSSIANVTLEVTYRFVQRNGSIQAEQHTVPLTADRIVTERDVALGAGYLLNLAVLATGGAPRIGQTFVCIKLIRGLTGRTIVIGLLLQGYVTTEQGLGWPGSPIVDSISGGGVIRGLSGTNPAAGIEISETVPTGARWHLLSFRAGLNTSGTVINRRPTLVVQGAGATAVNIPLFGVVGESTNATISWFAAAAVESSVIASGMIGLLPNDALLLAGDTITTGTQNLQTADDWSAPNLLVREWLEVNA